MAGLVRKSFDSNCCFVVVVVRRLCEAEVQGSVEAAFSVPLTLRSVFQSLVGVAVQCVPPEPHYLVVEVVLRV